MIPPRQEIDASLRAAWRLFLLDGEAVSGFNRSIEGFWRSFFAAVFTLPYYVMLLWGPFQSGEIGLIPAAAYFVASWTVFPIVAALLARVLRLGGNYVGYIIAYNWAGALMAQPMLLLLLLQRSGVIGLDGLSMFIFVLYLAFLWYSWAIARIALCTCIVTACGFVILAELIDMLLRTLILLPGGTA